MFVSYHGNEGRLCLCLTMAMRVDCAAGERPLPGSETDTETAERD